MCYIGTYSDTSIAYSDEGASPTGPLGQCEGNCSSDADCETGLVCVVRSADTELIPGCEPDGAGDVSGYNYCALPNNTACVAMDCDAG